MHKIFGTKEDDEPIFWEEKEIPLSLYVKVICYEGGTALRYSEFFTMLQNELSEEYKKIVCEKS